MHGPTGQREQPSFAPDLTTHEDAVRSSLRASARSRG
jgi:hypothetical protein